MAAELRRRFADGIPLYLVLSGLVTAFMALFVCLVGVHAWKESADLARAMADRAFAAAARSVKDGLEDRLLPLRALVEIGATLETGAGGFREEARILAPFFIRSLDAHASILALHHGAVNGNFFAVAAMRGEAVRRAYQAPEGTAYVLWRIEAEADGRRMDTREFRTATYTLIETRKTEAAYDPRERPWYRDAVAEAAQIMTDPYVFATAGEVGIACSRAAPDRRSVFSINILLNDVNDILASVPVAKGSLLLLLDKNLRLLAQSGSAHGWRKEFFARPLAEHPDPRVRAVAEHLAAHAADAGAHPIPSSFAPDTFLSRSEIAFGTRSLALVITAPIRDFTSVASPFFRANLLFALALLALFVPLTVLFARRVGRSLARLAEEVERPGERTSGGLSGTASAVLEVRRLARAVLKLETTLRDRTSRLVKLQDRRPTAFRDGPDRSGGGSGERRDPEEPAVAAVFPRPSAEGVPPRHARGDGDGDADPRSARGKALPETGESLPGIDMMDALPAGRVLLAESDPVNRQILMDLLDSAEILADRAEDGLEAVEKAWAGGYDLLLLGERLPGIDGRAVARLLRHESRLDTMPILLVGPAEDPGAAGPDGARVAGAPLGEDGIQDRLTTPIRPHTARAAVRHWIKARAPAAEGERFVADAPE